MEFQEVLEKRHSVRKFIQGKEIPPADIESLLDAANNSPSAGGLKAREILVVSDEKTKQLISDSAHNQKDDFIVKAGIVLIFCADKEKNREKLGERGKIYASQDATIACTFAHLKAVDIGLSSCFVGSFNEQQLIESLELKQNLYPIHILPIGFEEK